jgi:hypothetical protein
MTSEYPVSRFYFEKLVLVYRNVRIVTASVYVPVQRRHERPVTV